MGRPGSAGLISIRIYLRPAVPVLFALVVGGLLTQESQLLE